MVRGVLRLLPLGVLAGGLMLTACSASTAGTSGTKTPIPTPTPTPAGCAAIPGFEHATAASAGGRFTDVGFPSDAVGYANAAPEANGFQYQLIHVCQVGGSAAAVQSFHGSNLPAHGWMITATFPSTGDLSTACPSGSSCYIKNDGVIRFVAVESVATTGGLTTYTVRLVIQPYAFGGGLLSPSDTFDFDPTGPGSGTADVTWSGTQIVPSGAAKLINVGLRGSLNTVSFADVAGLAYAAAPIAAATLVPGDVFAVQTTDTHFVKVRVVSHSGSQLNLEYVTYPYTF